MAIDPWHSFFSMLSLQTAQGYIALCMLRFLQYELEAKRKEVLSAKRIMACISEPVVVVAGKYPDADESQRGLPDACRLSWFQEAREDHEHD